MSMGGSVCLRRDDGISRGRAPGESDPQITPIDADSKRKKQQIKKTERIICENMRNLRIRFTIENEEGRT